VNLATGSLEETVGDCFVFPLLVLRRALPTQLCPTHRRCREPASLSVSVFCRLSRRHDGNQSGEIRFYTDDSPITFNGGATEEGGLTAIRPVTGSDDNRRNIWVREDDSIVLYDGTGTEHVRLGSLSTVTKDRVPAIYSYDHTATEYLVHEPGETHTYESKASFENEWVPIKIPFVPEECLPDPVFGSDSYCIVILPVDGEPIVYTAGVTSPLHTLLETSFTTVQPESPSDAVRSSDRELDSGSRTSGENLRGEQPATHPQESSWKDDPDAAIG